MVGVSLRRGVRVNYKISSFYPDVSFLTPITSTKSHEGLSKEALAENKVTAALAQPRAQRRGEQPRAPPLDLLRGL